MVEIPFGRNPCLHPAERVVLRIASGAWAVVEIRTGFACLGHVEWACCEGKGRERERERGGGSTMVAVAKGTRGGKQAHGSATGFSDPIPESAGGCLWYTVGANPEGAFPHGHAQRAIPSPTTLSSFAPHYPRQWWLHHKWEGGQTRDVMYGAYVGCESD